MVVWSLSLPTDSEGPVLIPCAARLLSGGRTGLPSAPSWRTDVRMSLRGRQDAEPGRIKECTNEAPRLLSRPR